MQITGTLPPSAALTTGHHYYRNRLLAALAPADRALIEPYLETLALTAGTVLFEPGDEVEHTYFPSLGLMISFVIIMEDGCVAEAATVGREGAVGGIVSAGSKPAFARAVVQVPGYALRIETARIEDAKSRSPRLQDLFSRYADALLAQMMQSVCCNALHSLQARCCRWLLSTQDRIGGEVLALTQEQLSQMLGVQRTTVTRVSRSLQAQGLIKYSRGRMSILDRPGLEANACECYRTVKSHFECVLPETKPQVLTGAL